MSNLLLAITSLEPDVKLELKFSKDRLLARRAFRSIISPEKLNEFFGLGAGLLLEFPLDDDYVLISTNGNVSQCHIGKAPLCFKNYAKLTTSGTEILSLGNYHFGLSLRNKNVGEHTDDDMEVF